MSQQLYAYISLVVAMTVVKHSKKRCPGCIDNRKNPLSHLHEQLSLLQKYETYYTDVIAKIKQNLDSVIRRYIEICPEFAAHFEACTTQAHFFIDCSTARSLYYGDYTDDEKIFKALFDEEVTVPKVKTAAGAAKTGQSAAKRKKPSLLERAITDSYNDSTM
jgi:hypothetical protein